MTFMKKLLIAYFSLRSCISIMMIVFGSANIFFRFPNSENWLEIAIAKFVMSADRISTFLMAIIVGMYLIKKLNLKKYLPKAENKMDP